MSCRTIPCSIQTVPLILFQFINIADISRCLLLRLYELSLSAMCIQAPPFLHEDRFLQSIPRFHPENPRARLFQMWNLNWMLRNRCRDRYLYSRQRQCRQLRSSRAPSSSIMNHHRRNSLNNGHHIRRINSLRQRSHHSLPSRNETWLRPLSNGNLNMGTPRNNYHINNHSKISSPSNLSSNLNAAGGRTSSTQT